MTYAISYGTASGNFVLHKSPICHNTERPIVGFTGKGRVISLKTFGPRHRNTLQIKLVLDKQNGNAKRSISDYNTKINGFKDPARTALERLFLQTQRLEEQMMAASNNVQDSMYELNLEGLESDLQAALAALKKKEEELHAAERAVALDWHEVEHARKDLDRREKEISSAQVLQERLEEELKKYREDYAVQARKLKETKFRLDEKEREISTVHFALTAKDEELNRLRRELVKKDEELTKAGADLKSRGILISQANEVMDRQQTEIMELQRVVKQRENELMKSENKRREEEEKLTVSEASLEDRVVAWFLAQQELKNLAQEASKYKGNSLAAEKELKRVRNLLAEVKEQLKISQKSIESFRQRLQAQDAQLESQRVELSNQKSKIQSYDTCLRQACLEVENEREKLRLAESYRQEMEACLVNERESLVELQKKLQQERSFLNQARAEVSSIKKELEQKNASFNDAQTLLQLKESELVVARLEMQHLKSDVAFVQRTLAYKDKDLVVTKQNLEGLHEEISQLKCLMRAKEDQLLNATLMLKDKEEQVKTMQFDLDDNKLKLSEAASVVEHIADLTRTLVESAKEGKGFTMDEDSLLMETNCELFSTNRALLETELQLQHFQDKSVEDLRKWKHSEAELEAMKECLRQKEKELMEAHRALALKDQEIKNFLNQWEVREKELIKMREEVIEEANGLNSLHEIVQKRIGGKSLGELAIEKLELDAAHLEIEAAMSALRNLADLSHKLLIETKTSLDLSTDNVVLPDNKTVDLEVEIEAQKEGSKMKPREDLAALKQRMIERDATLNKTNQAITELSKLTKQMISEAGITHFEHANKVDEAADINIATNKEITANEKEATAV